MHTFITLILPVNFPKRLIQKRKSQRLTQQELADSSKIHVNQIKRYEAGSSQPTLEALIRLAQVLHVGLDDLVFDANDRGPDDELRLQFEALQNFSPEEKQTVKTVLEGLILKHHSVRFSQAS